MRCLVFLFLCAGARAKGDSDYIPVSVTSGVYWKEVDERVMYEASVPLVYKSKWLEVDKTELPSPVTSPFCRENKNAPKCSIVSWMLQVNENLGEKIQWLDSSLGAEAMKGPTTNSRTKRTLNFVGDFLHYCCGVATKRQLRPLFANQKAMSNFEQELNEQTQEAFTEINGLDFNMKNYTEKMERALVRVMEAGGNITRVVNLFQKKMFAAEQRGANTTLALTQLSTYMIFRQLQTVQVMARMEVLSQCRERKLPTFIVTLEKLKTDLSVLSDALGQDGYELAIPTAEITKYLRLELVECVISEEVIVVNIKIPIRRQAVTWKLYELITVPFAWSGKVCSIQSDATLFAISDEQITAIRGAAEQDCGVRENSLCFVPRYAGDAALGAACVNKIFRGATIKELSSLCVFKCVAMKEPLVSKVDDSTYILTHVSEILNVSCRYSQNRTIDLKEKGDLGAVEIKVPCDCKVTTNTKLLISEAYPCRQISRLPSATHTIPAAWSKLKSLEVAAQTNYVSNSFETLTECLNENWTAEIPHWNVTTSPHRVIKVPKLSYYSPKQSLFKLVLICVNILCLAVVSTIVIRNPYLLGIGTVSDFVRADDVYTDTEVDKDVLVFTIACTLILSLSCFIMLLKRCTLRKGRETRGQDVQLANTEGMSEGLPRNKSIATIDGRELRITLEWSQPEEGTPQ